MSTKDERIKQFNNRIKTEAKFRIIGIDKASGPGRTSTLIFFDDVEANPRMTEKEYKEQLERHQPKSRYDDHTTGYQAGFREKAKKWQTQMNESLFKAYSVPPEFMHSQHSSFREDLEKSTLTLKKLREIQQNLIDSQYPPHNRKKDDIVMVRKNGVWVTVQ